MKNVEIVTNLNNLMNFINREMSANKPFVNTIAKFKLKKNLKALKEAHAPYNECLQDLINQYELETDNNGNIIFKSDDKDKQAKVQIELQQLIQAENDVKLEMITDNDFTEDCLLGDMLLLDFMTSEVEEDGRE